MKKIFASRWFTVALVLAISWFGLGLVKVVSFERDVRSDVRELEAKISDMEEDNGRIERELSYFEDPLFLERSAKEKLNFKLPDESVFFVYLDETISASDSSGKEQKLLSRWQKWLKYLVSGE